MQQTEHRSFEKADEVREFPNGRAEILKVGDAEIGRLVLEPGWRWSNDVKPIAGTDSCTAPHFQYHLAGSLAIRMDDGTEFIATPGDVTSLPSSTRKRFDARDNRDFTVPKGHDKTFAVSLSLNSAKYRSAITSRYRSGRRATTSRRRWRWSCCATTCSTSAPAGRG